MPKKFYSFLILSIISFFLMDVRADQIPKEQTLKQTQNLLDQVMDPLNTLVYEEIYHKPINVSIGQQLSIVLPSFDSVYNPYTVQFKHLSDQQYAYTLKRLQSLNKGNQHEDFQNQKSNDDNLRQQQLIGNSVSEIQLPLKCNYIPSTARVYDIISKIGDESGYSKSSFTNKLNVLASSRQSLYVLNTVTMLLSVYYYNDVSIKLLSSFQLPISKDSHQLKENFEDYTQSHSSISMTLNSKQTELYIFSNQGIWIIQTKTFLTNIKKVFSVSGFQVFEMGGLDRIVLSSFSYFVGMKRMEKVFVIPEQSTEKNVFTQITSFYDEHIFPQDIAVHQSYLFVLDIYKGVYVYKIAADGKARQLFKIGLQSYGGNLKIHLFQIHTLFVNFNDFDGGKVVQISIDIENKKAQLVRYYKNDDFMNFIQTYNVLTSSTGFYLNQIYPTDQIDIKHVMNSAQTLLFMVTNSYEIQIFPFNLDPRTINFLFNGVKINYPKVKEIFHIFQDRFMIITEDTIDYVRISIQKPEVNCFLGTKYNEKYRIEPQNLLITIKSNVSTCEYRSKLFKQKVFYNQNCQLTTEYLVHINDPQKSSLRKLITYGIVLLVLVAFFLGLFCLIQWRNQKLVLLSRLKDEIIRFRNRHRRIQPFVEQKVPQMRQVQMEVPKHIQFISNEDQN